MMTSTMVLWFQSTTVEDKYKSAVIISGLVTFFAAYHCIPISDLGLMLTIILQERFLVVL